MPPFNKRRGRPPLSSRISSGARQQHERQACYSARQFTSDEQVSLFNFSDSDTPAGLRKTEQGEATWAEYLVAVRRIASLPNFPAADRVAVLQHENDIAKMAIGWDCHLCRHWSKRVFLMVADGRMKNGWQDAAAIKELQRDVCMEVVQAVHPRPLSFSHAEASRPQAHAQHQTAQAINPPLLALSQLRTTIIKTLMVKPVSPGTGGKTAVSPVPTAPSLTDTPMCVPGATTSLGVRSHIRSKTVWKNANMSIRRTPLKPLLLHL